MISLYRSRPFSFSPKFLHVIISFCALSQVTCLQLNCYPNFKREQWNDFKFSGNADMQNKALQITPESYNPALVDMHNQSGRVLFGELLQLWRRRSKDGLLLLTSFETSFQLQILPVDGKACAEGMAFILTSQVDPPNNSHGLWLGIVNETTNGSSSNNIVAVEFDTRKSYAEDLDDNHVGVNVNGLNNNLQFALAHVGVNLSSGANVLARIQYDGESKNLTVFVSMTEDKAYDSNPLFSIPIDLSAHLPKDVYVGFSGSTGDFIELNYINYWNFSSTNLKRGIDHIKLAVILPLILSACFLLGGTMCCCYFWRQKKRTVMPRTQQVSLNLASLLENSTKGPRKFRFKELKLATMNFDPKNRLGRGGFGTVYKGFLRDSNEEIAVKRVSKDSRQGEQEFAAEVMTISHLSHRNLVNLIGWCHEKDELLLVYEFMPNGSLDKHLFSNENSSADNNIILNWERRHKIICGVASALSYLHDGCRNRVLHRDVKSSNVMLDSDYNARLGDFGLARTIQSDRETHHLTTKVAGTPGYIAPESLLTGRASIETDVYGFGVFTMEVACGRRPGNNLRDQNNNIVEWLWDLYGRERLLNAVDPQLHGMFDREQMELVLKLGLACCHPNPKERPPMRVALQVLSGEAPAPVVPIEKPTFMWPVLPSVVSPLQESSSNGGLLTPSSDLTGR